MLAFAGDEAQAKLIRLRNQIIPTKPSNAFAPSKSAVGNSAVSGLFLVQFSSSPDANSRARLAKMGVDLLHYVPDDAFIARFDNAQLGEVQAIEGVKWIGAYRPEYKLERKLSSQANAQLAGDPLGVTVLMVPRARDSEVAAVRGLLSSVQQESSLHSGTILRGTLAPGQVAALSRMDSVLWIEAAPKMKLNDEVASKIVAGDGGVHTLLTQVLGYTGAGVKVAVADSGLDNGDAASMHPDLFGRTPAFFHYGNLTDAADEHSHGTHVAGIIAGNGATGEADDSNALYGLGVAPGASIIAQRIFDADGGYEPPTNGFKQLVHDATQAGAVIGSNSWGDDTQGQYDVSAMEFDELVRDSTGSGTNNLPYILEFSAGNAGPGEQTMDSPAVAKNVIATGAVENDRPDLIIYGDGPDYMADFSSRGPCADGRIKPDVVMPGTWISSLQSASATDQYAWAAIDSLYQYQGGTSQAGPHASGAAAVFVQYYRSMHTNATPSPALVKAALINSTVDILGADPSPNMDSGWGRVDLTLMFDPALTFQFVEQGPWLTNGAVFERHVPIASATDPLKITLAYTDVPAFPGSVVALVNDLDLEVVAPDGRIYRGNQFSDGESFANATAQDAINNVEGVFLSAPLPGEYVIRVRAKSVVQDVLGAAGAPRQDFALVISGVIPAPGVGVVILDRGSYTAPSQIKVTLIDTDQAGQPSKSVTALSGNEPLGESLLLHASGSSGIFTGAIATASGPPSANGRLEITNNDTIRVTYFDASASATRTATARGDFLPPVITGVGVSFDFGQALVGWGSDEPATSIVRYGTNSTLASLAAAVTNSDLVTSHSLSLGRLVTGRTYYYYVVSADEAGNVATNSNGGALFSFVAAPTATALLIDEYQDPFFGAPPLSGYTAPLDTLGLSYDVWDAAARGTPTLATLQPYRAVIWRVSELTSAWTSGERTAISNYLHTGGSLFVASMELLSRLEEAGATNFIHNVLQVRSYIVDPDSSGAAEIIGSPNEPVGNGIDAVMDYAVYDNLWGGLLGPDISDTIVPNTNATTVLRNDVGDIVGLRWPAVGQPAPGRLVFLTFPLDAVPSDTATNDRVHLLRNAISFLAPGASGVGTIALDSSSYTVPSLVTMEVGDGHLAGQGTMSVTAFSSTQTNGMTVTLQEGGTPGVFVGSFPLIAATNPPTAGKLRAKNGDTLKVQYFDASANTMVSSSASVDTIPPIISGVSAEPDYEEATVFWDSSEPADSLVQFGESAFLNRTAYDNNPTMSHGVTLLGLQPDRTYYYQVVSRDLAGNTTVDDNHGALYAFHTLLPLTPPWTDSMDTGATNWSVYSGQDAESEWTLGVPSNGQEASAHSPPNAWGSNLGGGPIEYSETFLISPAVNLTGGTSATLRFWHSYDFSADGDLDILEYGDLLIITNSNSAAPITLAEWSDDVSPGWIQEEIDLTPYLGHVIYLAWDYELLSFDSRPRPGWLVDDVSITLSNAPVGLLAVTNNLWQATFNLTGPSNFTGTGTSARFTNAPAGQYVINFNPVPYYQTAAPQTNTLAIAGALTFQGTYTFPDANTNGISDLWEQAYFGSVSPARTRFTDTDGDGQSDYAEFMVGTDPNNPNSPSQGPVLRLSAQRLANGAIRLVWPTSAGRGYQTLGSSNGVNWIVVTDWARASSSSMTNNLPSLAPGAPNLFRVQVRP